MIRNHTRATSRATRIGGLAAAAVVVAGAALTGTMAIAPAHADARDVVSVVTIRAVEESGPDWAGSDETYGGYQATDPRNGAFIAGFRTQFFQSVDSGDTKYLDTGRQELPAGAPGEYRRRARAVRVR